MKNGGGGGIRTHETLIMFTRFPSGLHRPLGHSSTGNLEDTLDGSPTNERQLYHVLDLKKRGT